MSHFFGLHCPRLSWNVDVSFDTSLNIWLPAHVYLAHELCTLSYIVAVFVACEGQCVVQLVQYCICSCKQNADSSWQHWFSSQQSSGHQWPPESPFGSAVRCCTPVDVMRNLGKPCNVGCRNLLASPVCDSHECVQCRRLKCAHEKSYSDFSVDPVCSSNSWESLKTFLQAVTYTPVCICHQTVPGHALTWLIPKHSSQCAMLWRITKQQSYSDFNLQCNAMLCFAAIQPINCLA